MKPTARVIQEPDGAEAAPSRQPRCVVLRDGTRVRARPIRGEDKDLLLDLFRRQSVESRYLRFMGGIGALSESRLRDLTEIDHVNHDAWIALDIDSPGEPCVGVARYVRLAKVPEVAEVAVAVVDSHQRRGIGMALLTLVGRSAAEHGIRTFRARVFDSNLATIRIFERHGGIVTGREGGVLCFEVPVPDPEVTPGAR